MAYIEGAAVYRIYTYVDLGAEPSGHSMSVRLSHGLAGTPVGTTETVAFLDEPFASSNKVTPAYPPGEYSDGGGTGVSGYFGYGTPTESFQQSAEAQGLHVGFNPDVGWYVDLQFWPLDASGYVAPIDPAAPAPFSPFNISATGFYDVIRHVIGVVINGEVVEIGTSEEFREVYDYYYDTEVPLFPAEVEVSRFWTSFVNTLSVDTE